MPPERTGSKARSTGGSLGVAAVDGPIVRNAADIAADLIRRAILEGRLEPGVPLREEGLADELGISRTPVREALLVLQTEGLVEAMPKRGSVVRSYGLDEIVDLYETRAVLEAYGTARAARSITESELGQLRKSCKRFAALIPRADPIEVVAENRVFHDVILKAARSASVVQLVGTATRVPLVYRSFFWRTSTDLEDALRYHENILAALARHDERNAESLMREHVLGALEILVEHLGGERRRD